MRVARASRAVAGFCPCFRVARFRVICGSSAVRSSRLSYFYCGGRKHDRLSLDHTSDRRANRRRACSSCAWRAKQEPCSLVGAGLQFCRSRADPDLVVPLQFRVWRTSISRTTRLDTRPGRGVSRRNRWAWTFDVIAHLDCGAHRDDCLVADSRARAALLFPDTYSPGVPLWDLHRFEFLSLVHLLGTKSYSSILPH